MHGWLNFFSHLFFPHDFSLIQYVDITELHRTMCASTVKLYYECFQVNYTDFKNLPKRDPVFSTRYNQRPLFYYIFKYVEHSRSWKFY